MACGLVGRALRLRRILQLLQRARQMRGLAVRQQTHRARLLLADEVPDQRPLRPRLRVASVRGRFATARPAARAGRRTWAIPGLLASMFPAGAAALLPVPRMFPANCRNWAMRLTPVTTICCG